MRALLFALCISTVLPVTVSAQTNPQADQNAYNYVVRCFAAGAFAKERGMPNDDGKRAYNMAQKLGSRLGYTAQQTDLDVRARMKTEMAIMLRDTAYLDKAFSDCRRLGLL